VRAGQAHVAGAQHVAATERQRALHHPRGGRAIADQLDVLDRDQGAERAGQRGADVAGRALGIEQVVGDRRDRRHGVVGRRLVGGRRARVDRRDRALGPLVGGWLIRRRLRVTGGRGQRDRRRRRDHRDPSLHAVTVSRPRRPRQPR
jgi:hypothetical protein